MFADDESEPGGGQAAGPAPVTRLSLPETDPSGREPVPDDRCPPVPSEQVDGDLIGVPRTSDRKVYIPVEDNVEVEIREGLPAGMTGDAEGNGNYFSYDCGTVEPHGPRAVVELAEPLGDRRLVVTHVFDPLAT